MAINNTRVVVGRYRGFNKNNGLRTVGAKNQHVLNFTVVINNSVKKGDEWEDGPSEWLNCVAWGKLAENIANNWVENDSIILVGEMGMKEGYTNKDGEEMPARPELNVKVGGHDNGYYPSTQSRPQKGESSSNSSRASTSKSAPKSKPANNNDELDLDALDMDSDMPF